MKTKKFKQVLVITVIQFRNLRKSMISYIYFTANLQNLQNQTHHIIHYQKHLQQIIKSNNFKNSEVEIYERYKFKESL